MFLFLATLKVDNKYFIEKKTTTVTHSHVNLSRIVPYTLKNDKLFKFWSQYHIVATNVTDIQI